MNLKPGKVAHSYILFKIWSKEWYLKGNNLTFNRVNFGFFKFITIIVIDLIPFWKNFINQYQNNTRTVHTNTLSHLKMFCLKTMHSVYSLLNVLSIIFTIYKSCFYSLQENKDFQEVSLWTLTRKSRLILIFYSRYEARNAIWKSII